MKLSNNKSPSTSKGTEIRHLVIGAVVFFLIEASRFLLYDFYYMPGYFNTIVLLVLITGTILAFAIHELCHRLMAQYYNLRVEFRLSLPGTIISLISIIVSPIKALVFGSVVIFDDQINNEKMGKIALAGPLINTFQAMLSVVLSDFFPFLYIFTIINTDLAMFNLIPIPPLEGEKVFTWSKVIWMIAFAASLIYWLMFSFSFEFGSRIKVWSASSRF
jgi:Zn-dependent protease